MGMKQVKGEEVERVAKLPPAEEATVLTDFDDSDKTPPKRTKRKRKSHDADDGKNNNDDSSSNRATTASRYAQKKSEKAQLKLQLQSRIPTHDPETGIPFNKIQVRRMMRRVKHGLSPIPTEEEENEIRAREKREKMEEEALMYAERRNDTEDASNLEDADDNDANFEDDGENNNDDQDGDNNEGDDEEEDDDVAQNGSDENGTTVAKTIAVPPPTKKAKRSKPVPPDYICQACQNKPQSSHSSSSTFTPHWIYDCPVKKTQRGCNQISKKLRGLHDPPSHKVFVSGLPFECDEGMVKRFFEETMGKNDGNSNTNVSAELVHCKLLKFEDSNRCKGQAFLTFDSEEGAKLAIRVMNGSIWKEIVEPGMAAKGKKKKIATAEGGPKKELKLKVTKALNRFVTKNKTGKGGG